MKTLDQLRDLAIQASKAGWLVEERHDGPGVFRYRLVRGEDYVEGPSSTSKQVAYGMLLMNYGEACDAWDNGTLRTQ